MPYGEHSEGDFFNPALAVKKSILMEDRTPVGRERYSSPASQSDCRLVRITYAISFILNCDSEIPNQFYIKLRFEIPIHIQIFTAT